MTEEIVKNGSKRFSLIGFFMIGFTLLAYGVQYLSIYLIEILNPSISDNKNTYMICIMAPLFIVELMVYLVGNKKIDGASYTKKKLKPIHWVMGLFICFAGMYISNLFGVMVTYIIGKIKGSAVTNPVLDTVNGMNTITTIIIVAIAAPILEELIFRKMLIDKISQYGEQIAVLTSALMFALFHGNLNQFVYAFVLGIIFGFIYIKTRNIKYTIFIHMIINFMGSVISMKLMELINYNELTNALRNSKEEYMSAILNNVSGLIILESYLFVIFVSVITGVVLFIINRKKFVFSENEFDVPKGQRLKTVLINPGMIIFCIIWVVRIIVQLFI